MTEQKFIKDVISKCRKEKQLTQEQLADLLNVSNKTVSKWERGISYPDITLIPTLAKVLDISVSELFDEAIEQPIKQTPKINTNSDIIYNLEIINKYRTEMFVSFITLIAAILLPLIFVCLIPIRYIVNIGYVIATLLALTSFAFAFFASYRYYYFFSNRIYQKLYLKTFNANISSYLFMIYFMLMVSGMFIVGDDIVLKVLVLLFQLIFVSIPFLLIKRKQSMHSDKMITPLRIISISLSCVIGVLYLFNGIILYMMILIISQIINYAILFIENKDTVLREN